MVVFPRNVIDLDHNPDIAGASQVTGGLRVAGEIKTPWVIAHSLSQAIQHTPCEELLRVLGRIAMGMQDNHIGL
ncbi:hypothetical protein AFLA_007571 [Aspergillus flavus NRRL3357]|nr:hypothetical protein AFLA_007571 [Aspergillus flavus NRRL3357]